jgi:hydrogenase/urease accessory protein HupE
MVFTLLVLPAAAQAHSPIKGINDFYNGALHPIFVPAHWMALLALGILFGREDQKKITPAILSFAVATVLGLFVTGLWPIENFEMAALVAAAMAGILIAARPRVSVTACALIASLIGLVIGLDSAQESLAGKARMAALFGSGVGIYLLTLYAMAFAGFFSKHSWQRIGLRVMGSWIAASALLVLSLIFRQ